MSHEIVLPKLGLTMEEADVASWEKEIGDYVDEDDVIMEVETDKANLEVESSSKGYLTKKLVLPGDTIEVGKVIAVLSENKDGDEDDDAAEIQEADKQPDKKPETTNQNKDNSSEPVNNQKNSNPFLRGGKIRISPAARKFAKEKDIDLEEIPGTGPRGRVVLKDVEQHEKLQEKITEAPRTSKPTVSREESDKVVSLSGMRRTIAERMMDSFKNVPQFTLTRSVDSTNMNDTRKSLNTLNSSEEKLSLNDFIIKAVADALERHPNVNAQFVEEEKDAYIIEKEEINIGLAVAIDDGLVVPVIPRANKLNVFEIARKRAELVKKAQNGLLTPDDMSGGTFSISNLGGFQVDEFTAIINPPESGIIAIGAAKDTPIVKDDKEIVIKPIMHVTAAFDHRTIDGAVGAAFLHTIVSQLESSQWRLI